NPSDDKVVVGGGLGLYAFNLLDGGAPVGWPYTTYAAIGLTNGSPSVVKAAVSGTLDGYYVVNATGDLYRVVSDGTFVKLYDTPGVGKSAAPLVIDYCWNSPTCGSDSDWEFRIFFGTGNTLYRYVFGSGPLNGDQDAVVLGGDLGDSTPLAGDANPASN